MDPVLLCLVSRAIHGQAAFIMKSFFFTFIGLSLPTDAGALAAGLVLGLVLLAARLPAVRLATAGAGLGVADRRLVTVAMPRGLAAGILATLPAAQGLAGTSRLPGIVFAAVVTSIVVFTVGFRFAAAGVPPTHPAAPGSGEEPPSAAAAAPTPAPVAGTP